MGVIFESPKLFFDQTDETLDLKTNLEIFRLTVTTEEDNQKVKIDGFFQVSILTEVTDTFSYQLIYQLKREEDNAILAEFQFGDTGRLEQDGIEHVNAFQPNFTIVDQPPTAGDHTYILETTASVLGVEEADATFRSMNAIVFP